MAQDVHNATLSKRAHKTILVTRGALCTAATTTRKDPNSHHMPGSLIARLSTMLVSTVAEAPVHNVAIDAETLMMPPVLSTSQSAPMDVDEAEASHAGQDIGTDTSMIYFGKTL